MHETFARGWDNTEGRWREVLWPRVCIHFHECLEGLDHVHCDEKSPVYDDPGTKLLPVRYSSSHAIHHDTNPSNSQQPGHQATSGPSRTTATDERHAEARAPVSGYRISDDEPAPDTTQFVINGSIDISGNRVTIPPTSIMDTSPRNQSNSLMAHENDG